MKKLYSLMFCPALALSIPASSLAQTATPLTLARYLDAVDANSLELGIQREYITSAAAGVSIASLRPDPVLTVGAGPRELGSEVRPKPRVGSSIELEWTLETGGKRDRRIKAASSAVALSVASSNAAKAALYATAAGAFVEACRTKEMLARQEESLRFLTEVVRVNTLRRQAGDISDIELLQSRTERDRLRTEVLRARADEVAARLGMAVPLGRSVADTLGTQPMVCDFKIDEADIDEDKLAADALLERDDVRMAKAALETAQANVKLALANRYVDPTISVSYGYAPRGRTTMDGDGVAIDGSPRSNTLGLSVSVPLPFSRMQRGELIQAESAVTQAMLGLRQAELNASTGVRQIVAGYIAARESVQNYRDITLGNVQAVLAGMQLSYNKGAATLLELLAAQRAANDEWLAYLQARADLATASVQLQLSAGKRPQL